MSDPTLIYQSTKTYTHSVGLSACFRQWRAESHCRFLHGYSLEVHFVFEAVELDVRNWVVDFGSLKSLKGWLEDTFDHKTLVAEDDPLLEHFQNMHKLGMLDLRVVPACGCEKFAEMIYHYTDTWLRDNGYSPRCILRSVEVKEHQGNSARVICVDALPQRLATNIQSDGHMAIGDLFSYSQNKGDTDGQP